MGTRRGLDYLKRTIYDFLGDDCPQLAASVSFYTFFALPPLLILLMLLAGALWDPQAVARALENQFAGLIGPEAAGQIRQIIAHTRRPDTGGPLPTLLSLLALIFGATGAFVALQGALNRIWHVKPDPRVGEIRGFLLKRMLSLGMVVGVAFLLLVSLALSAALAAAGSALASLTGEASGAVLRGLGFAVSFGIFTLLFAAMYKVLPDAEIAWREVWIGAVATAALFVAGKLLIGVYLGRSDPGNAYGAAGALAVIMIWIYYAGMVVLLGAEFTHVWAGRHGDPVTPEAGAMRVRQVERVEQVKPLPPAER